jgi:hypothetical protein
LSRWVRGRLAEESDQKDGESMALISDSTTVVVPHEAAPSSSRVPVALSSAGTWWLVATVVFALLVYYFVGVDQGAVSVFGNDMHVHEFLHDGRHVLAFPCH